MNFFAHQEQARRQTRRMLVMFALAVVAIVIAIDTVVVLAFDNNVNRGIGGVGLFAVSIAVVLVIGLGSLYRVATLRGGGSTVALQLGGRPVPADTGDFAYRRLRNVVEEIAIAAGVPVPDIFVLEEEAAINAFASGYAPTDAAVTVTRGALDKLTRAELQGVIGHEFSHILNGDMRLNIRLIGVVFGIVVIATVGRKIAQVAGRGGKDSAAPAVIGVALFLVGYLGVIFARMIKASISRQREFLADASAVQFTRQTEGIAGALKKIGGLSEGSKLASSDTEEVAHMLFGDGVGYSALFATHPPLALRIRKLDPAFREEQYAAIAAAWSQPTRVGEGRRDDDEVSISGFAPAHPRPRAPAERLPALPDTALPMRVSPAGVVRQVGNPGNDDRAVARTMHASIPDRLRQAAWHAESAMPLVFALLLSADESERSRQLVTVEQHYDDGTRALVETLARPMADLHPIQRLPLAALAFPALRRRPRPQLATFMTVLQALIDSDGQVTLDEYCLARMISLQVVDALDPAAALVIGRVKLRDVETELRDLLAIVARHGHDDTPGAQRAYALGLHEVLPAAPAHFAPPLEWISALDRALPKLDRLAPAGKELVVGALTRAISADGVVSVAEAELLRTVCAALHCPLPPILQSDA
jgi:Zn-dependent protease with chaperone function